MPYHSLLFTSTIGQQALALERVIAEWLRGGGRGVRGGVTVGPVQMPKGLFTLPDEKAHHSDRWKIGLIECALRTQLGDCSIEFQFLGLVSESERTATASVAEMRAETRRAEGSHRSLRCSSLAESVESRSMIPSFDLPRILLS